MPTPEEFKQFNRQLIAEFRANAGKVDDWDSLLLLTTIGAKSSVPHTTPLVYSTDGDRIFIIAATSGEPKHPAWYHNLLANPEVNIELDGESRRMRAVVAEGKEYERLFHLRADQIPETVAYQKMTTRRLPIVVLEQID